RDCQHITFFTDPASPPLRIWIETGAIMDQVAGYDHKVRSNDVGDVHEPVDQFDFLRITVPGRTYPIQRYMGVGDVNKGMFGGKGFNNLYTAFGKVDLPTGMDLQVIQVFRTTGRYADP